MTAESLNLFSDLDFHLVVSSKNSGRPQGRLFLFLTMKLFVDVAEVFVGDVRVDLGCADVAVAEHCLDGTQVSAVRKQIGGKNVTEGVRRYFFGNAGFNGVLFDHRLYCPTI